MKKNYSIIKTMIVLMILVAGKIGAQCTNPSAFGSATAPAPGGTVQVTTCMFAGEYGTINSIVAGNTYSTTSSIAGDFITIRSGTSNGPVVAFGITPLTWVATTAGTHFAHVNTNYACGTLNSCHTLNVGCYPAGVANDPCASAISILPVGAYPGTSIGSTIESPAVPGCTTGAPTVGGVWYTVIGNGNKLGLTTCGTAWDSKIWVYTGTCGAYTCVTDNDDNGPLCAGVAASVAWCSTAGVQYRVLVAGFSTSSAFTLNATQTVVATPTITASQNPICSGKTATLTGTGNSTYTFNPGNIAAATATVAPAATIQYTLTGLNAATGCLAPAAFITLTVNPTPTVAVNSGVACSGNSFTMAPSGALTYTFSSGSAVVTPTINTSYTVTGTAANGCTNTAVSSVTVNAAPTILVNSGAICSGSSFTMAPSGASTYTFSSGSAVVSPTANASYSVTGTSTAGCVSSSPAVSTVSVNAVPTVSVAGGSICNGQSFTLTPSGASTYTFSTGPVVSPSVTSSYSVTGTSAAGCVSSNTAVASVTVNASPTISIASGAICAGGSFTLSPSGASSYTYVPAGPVVSPTATATYSIIGTNTIGCSSNAVASVTVNASPTVSAVSNTSLICAGQTASLTASGAATYTWNTAATTTVIAVSPTVTTSYTVTGSGATGCTNTFTISQAVSPCTGINATTASVNGVLVYPNPNTGVFTIELNNGSVKNIDVMDLTGRIVLSNTTSNDKVDFNINTLANGVYYVRIQSNNTVEVIKIVKQ
ncbi:MAG: T9SS type A sorting domain-containing protein [Bacteroidetes bacterium]|nr:T9SS type A sorting domain-containing protein [Bacteroidota bacterium]